MNDLANMTATDPTYPLYPVFSLVCAALLFVILAVGVTHRNLNSAAAFLCLCLFLENLTNGINVVLWSGNPDVKLAVWCDIGQAIQHSPELAMYLPRHTVTRVQLATSIVKPSSTLLVARWLYRIASHQVAKPSTPGKVGSLAYPKLNDGN